MPLDASAEALMHAMDAARMGFYPDTTPESIRAALEQAAAVNRMRPHEVHSVEDRSLPGPAGDVPVRVYRPSADPSLPVLVWFHGGGWVAGSLETHDHLCRILCDDATCVVVSVGYRLAPETKFPGAIDDCVAAWDWVTGHAPELGGNPEHIAVGGDSAGGNLAACTALIARERGLRAPRLQLLVYPITEHEFERPSWIDNAKGYFLETEEMRWFFDHYAATPADFDDWRMSPLCAPGLAGLPPAVVVLAEYDPLRDQGLAYAERLRAEGVPTEIVRGDGLFHGYFGMHRFIPSAGEAWDVAMRALTAAFGKE